MTDRPAAVPLLVTVLVILSLAAFVWAVSPDNPCDTAPPHLRPECEKDYAE